MRSTVISLLTSFLLTTITGCRESHKTTLTVDGDTIFTPAYANGFTITSSPDSATKYLNITTPWQGALEDTRSLKISSPFKRIVTLSSTHVAMLDALGCGDRVVGVSGLDYICSPSVVARRDSIVDIGYDANINYEALIAARPDLVLLYGVYGPHPMEGKLNQLGIPYIYIGDYIEESPIGKAEWIIAMGAITGLQEKAINLFNEIPLAYNATKSLVDTIQNSKPRILLNTPYGDAWYMPPVGSYMVTLIEDAGGEYLFSRNDTGRSIAVDTEEVFMMALSADFWLNPGTSTSLSSLLQSCPRFIETPPVTNRRVYNNNHISGPSGGNAFYETAIIHPQTVLRDLIKIFHPELVKDDFVYYQQLQ